jgi:hypothetical protein
MRYRTPDEDIIESDPNIDGDYNSPHKVVPPATHRW